MVRDNINAICRYLLAKLENRGGIVAEHLAHQIEYAPNDKMLKLGVLEVIKYFELTNEQDKHFNQIKKEIEKL